MFLQRHSSRSCLTYDLTYPIPHKDHLVRGIKSTKTITRRDTPSVCVVLEEEVHQIVSRIVHPNGKFCELRRMNKHDIESLPMGRTSVLRYTKYEGYHHETHQCPNLNTTSITN